MQKTYLCLEEGRGDLKEQKNITATGIFREIDGMNNDQKCKLFKEIVTEENSRWDEETWIDDALCFAEEIQEVCLQVMRGIPDDQVKEFLWDQGQKEKVWKRTEQLIIRKIRDRLPEQLRETPKVITANADTGCSRTVVTDARYLTDTYQHEKWVGTAHQDRAHDLLSTMGGTLSAWVKSSDGDMIQLPKVSAWCCKD